jgi:hypothetical protein
MRKLNQSDKRLLSVIITAATTIGVVLIYILIHS